MSQFPGPFDTAGTRQFIPDRRGLSPQLYEAANAKLERIAKWLYGTLYWQVKEEAGYHDVLLAVRRDLRRCQLDLKYEYLGLKDSWL